MLSRLEKAEGQPWISDLKLGQGNRHTVGSGCWALWALPEGSTLAAVAAPASCEGRGAEPGRPLSPPMMQGDPEDHYPSSLLARLRNSVCG